MGKLQHDSNLTPNIFILNVIRNLKRSQEVKYNFILLFLSDFTFEDLFLITP